MKISQKSKIECRKWSRAALLFLFYFSLLIFNSSLAQQPPAAVKKSDKIETVEGKKFYIHTVEKGQTLYSIAKAYGTTVDIVLANNPEVADGLKTGGKLKIPFLGELKKETTDSKEKVSEKGLPDEIKDVKKKNSNDTIAAAAALPVKPIGDIHVALFLPLSLAWVEKIDVGKIAHGDEKLSEETRTAIEFYEGMKMAYDSLKKQGFAGRLHVYDYNLDSAGFVKLMKKPEMKEMDLIIGPLYGKRFDLVLKFAKANNINIVSPSIQGNNILMGNPHVSKVTPSYATQAEELAKYIAEKHRGENIIVFNSANSKDKPYINTFKKTANPLLTASGSDTVKEVTFTSLKNFMSKTKPNIIAIPSTNQSFVAEAVNKLYQAKQENSKDSILVFGMSNWQDMESLDFGYQKTLYTHLSAYSFVDYSNPLTKKFIIDYRQEFKTDPSPSVFSGFDVGYYYLGGLQKYGNELQRKLPEIKHKGIQTEFSFSQPDATSGYENKGVGIMRFENYMYVRVK